MDEELKQRFEEAGTTFERLPDGRIAVTNWPKPRVSGDAGFLRRCLERGTGRQDDNKD